MDGTVHKWHELDPSKHNRMLQQTLSSPRIKEQCKTTNTSASQRIASNTRLERLPYPQPVELRCKSTVTALTGWHHSSLDAGPLGCVRIHNDPACWSSLAEFSMPFSPIMRPFRRRGRSHRSSVFGVCTINESKSQRQSHCPSRPLPPCFQSTVRTGCRLSLPSRPGRIIPLCCLPGPRKIFPHRRDYSV